MSKLKDDVSPTEQQAYTDGNHEGLKEMEFDDNEQIQNEEEQ